MAVHVSPLPRVKSFTVPWFIIQWEVSRFEQKKLIKTLKQFKYHISQISLFDWMASLILENIIHEMQVQHIGSFNLNTFVKLVKFAKSVVQKYNLSVEGSSYRFFGLLFHLCFLLLACFLQEKLDYKCNFISLELHLCELR